MPLAAPGDWPVKIREFNSSQTCAEFKSAFYVIRITDITVWSFTHRALSRTTRFQISRDVTCGHPNTVVYTVGFSAAFYSTFSRTALRPPRRVFYVSGCFRIAGYRPPLGRTFSRDTRPPCRCRRPPCHHRVCYAPPRLLRTTAFATHDPVSLSPAPCRHHVCCTRCPAANATENRCAMPCAPLGVPPCGAHTMMLWSCTRRAGEDRNHPLVISILQDESLTLFLVRTFCRIIGLHCLQD